MFIYLNSLLVMNQHETWIIIICTILKHLFETCCIVQRDNNKCRCGRFNNV